MLPEQKLQRARRLAGRQAPSLVPAEEDLSRTASAWRHQEGHTRPPPPLPRVPLEKLPHMQPAAQADKGFIPAAYGEPPSPGAVEKPALSAEVTTTQSSSARRRSAARRSSDSLVSANGARSGDKERHRGASDGSSRAALRSTSAGGSRPSQPVVITQLPLDRVQPVIGRPSVVRPGSVPVTQLLSGRTGVHTTTTGDTSTSSRRLSRRSTSSFSSDSPRSRSLLSGPSHRTLGSLSSDRDKREPTPSSDLEPPVQESVLIDFLSSLAGVPLLSSDLLESLQDGTVICKVMNAIRPHSVEITPVPLSTTSAMVQRRQSAMIQNVKGFLDAARQLGVPENSLFEPLDLVEKLNGPFVLRCLMKLASMERKEDSSGTDPSSSLGLMLKKLQLTNRENLLIGYIRSVLNLVVKPPLFVELRDGVLLLKLITKVHGEEIGSGFHEAPETRRDMMHNERLLSQVCRRYVPPDILFYKGDLVDAHDWPAVLECIIVAVDQRLHRGRRRDNATTVP